MNQEERISAINLLCRRANRLRERVRYTGLDIQDVSGIEEASALDKAISALRGPVPDPETGLVPCGCGGKAICLNHHTPDGDYFVKCEKCKTMTDWFNSPQDAIASFNRAMGYKE